MKIAVIDSTCLYNDILQSFITNSCNIRETGGVLCYIGAYPTYEEMLRTLATYVYKFYPNYFQLHVLVSTITPKLLSGHIVGSRHVVYKNIVKALTHINKSHFSPISIFRHEYSDQKMKTSIITNIQRSVGAINCDIVPCQYTLIVA